MSRDEAIRGQVERILATQEFRSSQRLSRLLRYLTEHFVAEPEQSISEYQLGFEVFERPADFDPQVDSVVRVQVIRLRQKLSKFYAEIGTEDEVLIEIPRGAYSASVTFREFPNVLPDDPSSVPISPQIGEQSASRSRLFPSWAIWLASATLLLTTVAATVFRRTTPQNTKSIEPTVISFTSGPGVADNAAFSPNGASVAYSGSSGDGREIFIKDIKSGRIRQVTHDSGIDVNPAWSPDGSSIAFYRAQDRPQENSGEFATVPSTGGAVHAVVRSQSGIGSVGPAWAGDRDHFIIAGKNGAGSADCLFLIDLKDGSRKQLTSPPVSAIGDEAPAVSPDGKTIAFFRLTSTESGDIFLMPLSGGQPRRITFDNADVDGLAWTANGRQLIFSSNRKGIYRLWRLSIDTGQIDAFPGSGLSAFRPATDPTRNRLIYSEITCNTNIWRVDLRSPLKKQSNIELITSTQLQDSPRYSPDGSQIAFVSDRSGFWEIWLTNSSGGDLRRLTHFDGPLVGSPQWSPDGKEIAFDLREKGVSNIFAVSLKTAAVRQITKESSDTMAPKWSSDGRALYVTSRRTGPLQIWRISPDGTLWTQLTHNGGSDGTELPEKSQLLFTIPGSPGFWTLDLHSGKESVIPELASASSHRYWTTDSSGLYYVSGADGHWSINIYNFRTHHITKIIEMSGGLFDGTPSLTVSPDGRYLAYSQLDLSGSELELVENW